MITLDKWMNPRPLLPEQRRSFSDAALKAMIIPLMIEQLLQMVVGLADTMMVSYAGEAVVAGVGLDTMIYTIFIYLFTAVSAGGAVVVAQYIGSREKENADLAASQVFHLAGLLSLACMALMLLFGSALLQAMYPSTEPATMEACKTYMRIVALSFPANALYNAGAAVYRSMGQTRVTMWVSLAANLVNAAGNAIGIFVLKAGAAGVAWPTTISWYIAAVIMTGLCLRKKNGVSIHPGQVFRLKASMSRRILSVAIPNSVENTLFQAAKVVLGMLVATFGTSQIAANTTGQTFWSLAACMGVSMGTHGIYHGCRTVRRRRGYGSGGMVYPEADPPVAGPGRCVECDCDGPDAGPPAAVRPVGRNQTPDPDHRGDPQSFLGAGPAVFRAAVLRPPGRG